MVSGDAIAPAISSCFRASHYESGRKYYSVRRKSNVRVNQTDSELGRPIAPLRWSILLNGTGSELLNGRLPHPMRAMSSGIPSPASRIAVMLPMATGSLQQKTPVGRGSRLITLTDACYPASEADMAHSSMLTMYFPVTGMPWVVSVRLYPSSCPNAGLAWIPPIYADNYEDIELRP